MKARTQLLLLAGFITTSLAGIAFFNFRVDPFCYYRCYDIDAALVTNNVYYQAAQKVVQFPESEMIILASSRGESLPLKWFADATKLKTLNLSVGGAEFSTKLLFLNFAETRLKLKKVIWIADYFELINEVTNDKIHFTPALLKYASYLPEPVLTEKFRTITALIDHNTVEASFSLLKKRKKPLEKEYGPNADMTDTVCEKSIGDSRLTQLKLAKEVATIYDGYANRILQPTQNEESRQHLADKATALVASGIRFTILIPPYHPEFTHRLKKEFPQIYERHKTWRQKLLLLKNKGVDVRDYFEDFPSDDGSPKFWTDGIHFTCYAAMKMLQP